MTNLDDSRPSLSAAERAPEADQPSGPDDTAAEQTSIGCAPSGETIRLVRETSRIIKDGINTGLSTGTMVKQIECLFHGRIARDNLKRSLDRVLEQRSPGQKRSRNCLSDS